MRARTIEAEGALSTTVHGAFARVSRGHPRGGWKGSRAALGCALVAALWAFVSGHARADGPSSPEAPARAPRDAPGRGRGLGVAFRLQPPPPPAQRATSDGGELHVQLVLPLAPALCPRDGGCLLNGGFGIGGSLERRWAFGVALLLGYDLALLDAEGIFEVSTLQTLRVGARWVVPLDTVLQPYAEFGVGAVLFGDSFGVATAGAALQLGVGGELELTPRMALVGGLVFRGFTTGAFSARADGEPGPRDPGANFALLVQVGILLLDDPVP